MIALVIYLILGYFIARTGRLEDDQRLGVSDTLLVMLAWPYVLFALIRRAKRLTWRGKTLWERKS